MFFKVSLPYYRPQSNYFGANEQSELSLLQERLEQARQHRDTTHSDNIQVLSNLKKEILDWWNTPPKYAYFTDLVISPAGMNPAERIANMVSRFRIVCVEPSALLEQINVFLTALQNLQAQFDTEFAGMNEWSRPRARNRAARTQEVNNFIEKIKPISSAFSTLDRQISELETQYQQCSLQDKTSVYLKQELRNAIQRLFDQANAEFRRLSNSSHTDEPSFGMKKLCEQLLSVSPISLDKIKEELQSYMKNYGQNAWFRSLQSILEAHEYNLTVDVEAFLAQSAAKQQAALVSSEAGAEPAQSLEPPEPTMIANKNILNEPNYFFILGCFAGAAVGASLIITAFLLTLPMSLFIPLIATGAAAVVGFSTLGFFGPNMKRKKEETVLGEDLQAALP